MENSVWVFYLFIYLNFSLAHAMKVPLNSDFLKKNEINLLLGGFKNCQRNSTWSQFLSLSQLFMATDIHAREKKRKASLNHSLRRSN